MTKKRKKKKKRHPDSRQRLAWLMLLLLIPIAGGIIWMSIPKKPAMDQEGFQFTKEGELSFVRPATGDTLATIDVEVADDELEIQRGLMWRREMEDNQGMLFLMEVAEPQSFWMLNTYLPLDIIFVDENRRILNIAENTRPESLDPIRSTGDALYVVEVLAGFSERYGLQPGDEIVF